MEPTLKASSAGSRLKSPADRFSRGFHLMAAVLVGGILLAAGVDKVFHYYGFVNALSSYVLVPAAAAPYLALPIILVEIFAGATLFLQRWRANAESNLYYAGVRVPILAAYNPDGDLLFIRRTITPPPVPQVEFTATGSRKVAHSGAWATMGMSIDSDEIHLLTRPKDAQEEVVDVYEAADGSYRFSYRLPVRATAMQRIGNDLFVVSPEGAGRLRVLPSVEEKVSP